MAEYGKMDPFSFAGSKDVDHPVSIRMYDNTLSRPSNALEMLIRRGTV
jgi:phosphatidylinositol 3-kinase